MSKRGGFTLLEMAIVVLIVSMVIGLSISSGLAMLSNARAAATQQKMAIIDQALMAYRMANDQLPCPSDLTQGKYSLYYGTSQTSAGYCVQVSAPSSGSGPSGVNVSGFVVEGGVPVVDLGLPSDYMYDGWGNRIAYAVDDRMANMGMGAIFPYNTNTFSGTQVGAPPGPGGILVWGLTTGGTGYFRSVNAVYVLMSHGPNGYGAFNINGTYTGVNTSETNGGECANTHYFNIGTMGCVSSYIYVPFYVQAQAYGTTAANSFDDIVTYKERWQMQTGMDKPGTLPPAVYVADSTTNSIIVLDKNLASASVLHSFTGCTGNATAFNDPQGVYADNFGNLWIADLGNYRVLKCGLSLNGSTWTLTYLGAMSGMNGGASITLADAAAVDNAGNVWMAELWYYIGYERLLKFDRNLNFILAVGAGYNGVPGTIGSVGTSLGAFYTPRGVVVAPDNSVWTADLSNNRLQQFDSSGNVLQEIGSSCTPGSAATPACSATSGSVGVYLSGLAMDKTGSIYIGAAELGYGIAKVNNNSSNSNMSLVYGTNFGLDCNNSHATAIAVDPEGYLWITSSNESNAYIVKGVYGSYNCVATSTLVSSGDFSIAIPGTTSR